MRIEIFQNYFFILNKSWVVHRNAAICHIDFMFAFLQLILCLPSLYNLLEAISLKLLFTHVLFLDVFLLFHGIVFFLFISHFEGQIRSPLFTRLCFTGNLGVSQPHSAVGDWEPP